MGNCNFRIPDQSDDVQLSQGQFKFIDIIGKGGFSKVWKVEHRKTKQFLALKMMSKAKIISKKSVHSVMNELQLLSQLNHLFIINMQSAFQDKRFLYLGMDLLQGGDLRYHICRTRRFSEEQTKFFVMCLIIGLEYLHQNSVIHRDIKPENLVFDEHGYLHITDLGIARIWKPQNSSDTSGTPGYMAPEVMCRQNHGVGVDYYAVGVIIYELMLNRRPYSGKTRQEIREQMLARQVQIQRHEIPTGWSDEAADIANKLIVRKPQNRLGVNGPEDIKRHQWFRGSDWSSIMSKSRDPPFIPSTDKNYSNKNFLDSQSDLDEQNELLLRRDSIQGLFQGYGYGNNQQSMTMSSQRTSSVIPVKTTA